MFLCFCDNNFVNDDTPPTPSISPTPSLDASPTPSISSPCTSRQSTIRSSPSISSSISRQSTIRGSPSDRFANLPPSVMKILAPDVEMTLVVCETSFQKYRSQQDSIINRLMQFDAEN